jgi:hypothetical protein
LAAKVSSSKHAASTVSSGWSRRSCAASARNAWIGLVHYYVIKRELFAPGKTVLREHGPALLDHSLTLVSTRSAR